MKISDGERGIDNPLGVRDPVRIAQGSRESRVTLTRDGYPKFTEADLERLQNEEAPYWSAIRKLRRTAHASVEEAAKVACRIAWNLMRLTGDSLIGLTMSEYAGLIVQRTGARQGSAFEFLGPERGVGAISAISLQIPRGTTYQAIYHTHPEEMGPSPEDDKAATETNLPMFICLKSGKVTLYRPEKVAPDKRRYAYFKEIAVVRAPPEPIRMTSSQPLERKERQLWAAHLKWRLDQIKKWLTASP